MQESSFTIQSMVNEVNAICRRFGAPYSFSRKDALVDGLEPTICVHDRDRHLVLTWDIETLRRTLETCREAVEDSLPIPFEALFETGQVWQPEEENLTLVAPTIRDKLTKLKKRNDCSPTLRDEDSRLSLDTSSRRSSLLCRSPLTNASSSVVDSCRQMISNFSVGDLDHTFVSISKSLRNLLIRPERTAGFAVLLTGYTFSLVSVLPGLTQKMIGQRDVPSEFRSSWTRAAQQICNKLQIAVECVMQVPLTLRALKAPFSY